MKSRIRQKVHFRRCLAPLVLGMVLLLPLLGGATSARERGDEDAPIAETKPQNPSNDLKAREEQIASQYKRLEEVMLRMAELTASEDPQRANLLRQAVARGKKRLIALQFERLVELLAKDQLSVAITNENDLMQDLKGLLELLLNEDRAKRLDSEQQRIRGYLKELNKLIAEQQGIQSQTRRSGEETTPLAERQGRLADRTNKLHDDIKKDADESRQSDQSGPEEEKLNRDADRQKSPLEESSEPQESPEKSDRGPSSESAKDAKPKSGSKGASEEQDNKEPDDAQGSQVPSPPADQQQQAESQPAGPTDSARQRLDAARQRMRDAQQRLKQAQQDAALDDQRQALDELERAKADLEKILRQLREEELARVLTFLEARFRKMLEDQTQVYDATVRLRGLSSAERDRTLEIESGRLSRKESQIAIEADKALTLLREDATAVAMPEAVRELRDDMQQVATRLGEFKLDAIAQAIEEDILAGLEDILAALEKAQKDLEQKQNNQQPPPPGEPQEPPLVDSLAELKVIRALQMRVNRRTETYAKLVAGEQAVDPEVLEALDELAARQDRIYRTTRDIAIGKNQ